MKFTEVKGLIGYGGYDDKEVEKEGCLSIEVRRKGAEMNSKMQIYQRDQPWYGKRWDAEATFSVVWIGGVVFSKRGEVRDLFIHIITKQKNIEKRQTKYFWI